MKRLNRKLVVSLVLTLLMVVMIVTPASAASPIKVNLGTTSNFAVLAGSAITNTGTTTINGDAGGDVGLTPGSAFGATGVTMSGASHINDAVAGIAQTDLVTAYNDAVGRTPTDAITTDLGGTTLTPGVYNSASSIGITGTLTLDAQGDPEAVFIFQAGSTLITATDSQVKLINGARYCRVFWQVGSAATLGTNSVFVGHIFALTSITANTGATVQGQLLARNGAVTLDNNTIINGICADAVNNSPIIRITKTAAPLELPPAGGSVNYTYVITNPGIVALSNVHVTDNKLSRVNYVSGDINSDNLLQPNETWTYTGTTTLRTTTTNTATAIGIANGVTVTDTTNATVVVTTVTGGQIPDTATPWYNILLIGSCVVIIGAIVLSMKKIRE